jgi:hypothetical protein
MVEKEDVTNVERTPMSTARTLRHLRQADGEAVPRTWVESAGKPRLRPRTYTGYKQHVDVHIVPALGHLRLHALNPQQVQSMLAGLQLKKLAPRTIRGVRAVLRAALSDSIRWRLVARNAAALSHAPRVSRPS